MFSNRQKELLRIMKSKKSHQVVQLTLVTAVVIVTLACGIIFQSITIVDEDENSTTVLTIAMDKSLLMDASINQRWQQQIDAMTEYMLRHGAVVQPYDDDLYKGIQGSITFPDLDSLNVQQSSEELSIFDSFTIKRWRGEFVFEAHTTSALISQQILQITGISESELLLVQFPLNISLQLPGDLIRTNADQIDGNEMQTWAIDWWFQEEHPLYATSRVPLIPPVITEPETGARIKDASEGIDFAGTGEPGADLYLYRVEGDQRTVMATSQIDATGQWTLPTVQLGELGQYVFQVEERTDHESYWSDQPSLEYRPLEPIVFVPGFYSCSEGIFHQDLKWHWGWFPSDDPGWETTGLVPGVSTLYYGALLRYFIDQGYELNENLFVACYDWTSSLPEEASRLKEALDWARYQNPTKMPVTVITHSNGGLVARYHIQNNPLRTVNQISDLIMIAPPNHGVAKAYYIWAGGEVKESGILRQIIRVALATKCGGWMLSLNSQKVYDCLRYGRGIGLASFDLATAHDDAIMSVAWFLPDWDFLANGDDLLSYPHAPISRLNTSDQIAALFEGIQGNVYVIAGNTGRSTLSVIPVVPPLAEDAPLWQNGKPDTSKALIYDEGDDTILLDSIYLPEAEHFVGRYYPILPYSGADHAKGVVQTIDVLTDLSEIIRENLPTSGEAEFAVSDFMIIWVESPVDLLVTDAAGKRIGVDLSGNLIGEIPDAAYGDTGDPLGPKYIIIPNPIEGQYQFVVTGLTEGDYGLYGLSSTSEIPFIAEIGHIQPGEVRTFTEPYTISLEEPETISARRPLFLICGTVGLVFVVILLITISRHRKRRQRDDHPLPEHDWNDFYPPKDDDFKRKKRWRRRRKKEGWDEHDSEW